MRGAACATEQCAPAPIRGCGRPTARERACLSGWRNCSERQGRIFHSQCFDGPHSRRRACVAAARPGGKPRRAQGGGRADPDENCSPRSSTSRWLAGRPAGDRRAVLSAGHPYQAIGRRTATRLPGLMINRSGIVEVSARGRRSGASSR